ncbi:hypothetical protein [Sphingomonas qomolangmaensis]|uniref:Uncharacterized protein n=1 Tax=Sphingomonas qomolangmaensis TaxID=2918765 RepID=A0ABY5LED7_9SPHN|nr:hypothetical protein [Sphingomonas qomolangmaensis]UUL84104.1 hypothetical protein NMP03_07955 [Sphingomonas qomolangmaensis]
MCPAEEFAEAATLRQQIGQWLVVACMKMLSPHHGTNDDAMHVVIAMPQAGDTIGGVLRRVYGRERALPGDMLELLARIDASPALDA